MKIAILTLRGEFNYGNILQTYALQKVLKAIGEDVQVLNRRTNYPTKKLFLIRIISILKCIIRRYLLGQRNIVVNSPFAEDYIIHEDQCIDNSALIDFTNKYLNVTKPFRNTHELSVYAQKQKFDCYVVGSDQVWREGYTPRIEDFFLGFLPETSTCKKIAYAASFGTNKSPISKEKLNICSQLAKRFDAISVREKSAIDFVKQNFDLNAIHVLDPTLLLDVDDYRFLITPSDDVDSHFCLSSYILDDSEEKNMIISECEEILQTKRNSFFTCNHEGGKRSHLKSISKWLSIFKRSDFIITDSFHGCVFSIIFKKNFIVIANRMRGIDRFESILNLLSLQDRLVLSSEDFENRKSILLQPIDYSLVNTILEQEKVRSLKFLKVQILNDKK